MSHCPASVLQFARRIALVFVSFVALAHVPCALAVPSFARQTGLPCAQCHVQAFGPALTPFGRDFKLNGYTLASNEDSIHLSAMLVGTATHTDKKLPFKAADHYDDNNNAVWQEASLFYAGKISDHVGTFTQVTYSGIDRSPSWDNMDTRYANRGSVGGHEVVYGVSVNNSPTTQDLWNSTPAWGFPYVDSELAPGPAAGPLISDGLGQQVLGTTAYTMIDNHWYLEAGAYKSLPNNWLDHLAGTSLDSPRAKGLMPYWRAAYQGKLGDGTFSVGTFGLHAKLDPDSSVAGNNTFTDIGLDGTYQFTCGDHTWNTNVSWIREDQQLNDAFNAAEAAGPNNRLDSFRINVDYAWRQTWAASLGWFDTRGARDAGLYAPDPVEGSNSGKPDSRGYTVQLEYIPWGKMGSWMSPWANVRLGVQYTGYDRMNGGSGNYDGFGRSASDNDTLTLFMWWAI